MAQRGMVIMMHVFLCAWIAWYLLVFICHMVMVLFYFMNGQVNQQGSEQQKSQEEAKRFTTEI